VVRRKERYRRSFIGNAFVRKTQAVRRKLVGFLVATRPVVLRDDRAARLDVGEQPGKCAARLVRILNARTPMTTASRPRNRSVVRSASVKVVTA